MDYTLHTDRTHIMQEFAELTDIFYHWAQEDANVLTAVVLGSQAHRDVATDEWSDIDIAVIVRDATVCCAEEEWLSEHPDYAFTFVESAGIGNSITRHLVLSTGRMIDLSFFSLADVHNWMGDSKTVKAESQGFFRSHLLVLIDKIGLMQQLMADEDMQSILRDHKLPPSEEALQIAICHFWYHALRSLKHIYRADLWRAIMSCNVELKQALLQLIEWNAKARHGWDYDTRYEGRMINEWAEPEISRTLASTFATYDVDGIKTALQKTIALFEVLSEETAQMLGYDPSPEGIEAVSRFAKQRLAAIAVPKNLEHCTSEDLAIFEK